MIFEANSASQGEINFENYATFLLIKQSIARSAILSSVPED